MGGLATDGALPYAVDGSSHEIVAIPVDGGMPGKVATVSTGTVLASEVRVDDRYVYWIDGTQKAVMRAPKCVLRTPAPLPPTATERVTPIPGRASSARNPIRGKARRQPLDPPPRAAASSWQSMGRRRTGKM